MFGWTGDGLHFLEGKGVRQMRRNPKIRFVWRQPKYSHESDHFTYCYVAGILTVSEFITKTGRFYTTNN